LKEEEKMILTNVNDLRSMILGCKDDVRVMNYVHNIKKGYELHDSVIIEPVSPDEYLKVAFVLSYRAPNITSSELLQLEETVDYVMSELVKVHESKNSKLKTVLIDGETILIDDSLYDEFNNRSGKE